MTLRQGGASANSPRRSRSSLPEAHQRLSWAGSPGSGGRPRGQETGFENGLVLDDFE